MRADYPDQSIGWREAELRFGALGVGLGLATRFLRRRFECAEPTDFVHDSLGVEFALQAFESAIDGLSFANDNFRHFDFPWGDGFKKFGKRAAIVGGERPGVNNGFRVFSTGDLPGGLKTPERELFTLKKQGSARPD
jgi:hypothetical protein